MSDDLAVVIRDYVDDDFDELVAKWHETNLVSYRYVAEQQRHTLSDARAFFRDKVLPTCEIRVATRSGRRLGLLAFAAPWIRHFTIFPAHQRQGIGTALLHKVRERFPAEIRLYTFQRNVTARAFYEKHGFTAVAYGVSPAPESEPDVLYHWLPRR
jgi:ribosomal protein S18 acetylase RimI-like enzyme